MLQIELVKLQTWVVHAGLKVVVILIHLPAGGEVVIFDRSWYNRAGVEYVMGFWTDQQHKDFLQVCPAIERALINSGIILIKYWFDVSQQQLVRQRVIAEAEELHLARLQERLRNYPQAAEWA
jgi:polyphosphate kinase 2 (PPK2 family)